MSRRRVSIRGKQPAAPARARYKCKRDQPSRGHGAFKVHTMKTQVKVDVKIDLASCLWALAFVIFIVVT